MKIFVNKSTSFHNYSFRIILVCIAYALISAMVGCVPTPKSEKEGSDGDRTLGNNEQTPYYSSSYYPRIANITPSSGYTTTLSSDTQVHLVEVLNPSSMDYTIVWKINGVAEDNYLNNASYILDPKTLSKGTYILSALITSSDLSMTYDSSDWLIVVDESSFNLDQTPALADKIIVLPEDAIGNGNWKLEDDTIVDPTVNLTFDSSLDGSITAIYYYNNVAITPAIPVDNGVDISLGTFLASFAITPNNPYIPETGTLTCRFYEGSTLNSTYASWTIAVTPLNATPTLTAVTTGGSPDIGPVIINQNIATTFRISANDDQTELSDLDIKFFLNGVEMDGVNYIAGTNQLTPNCVGKADTLTSCTITFPSYTTTAPNVLPVAVEPIDYTLSAIAYDSGGNGAPALSSAPLVWSITISEDQNEIIINDFKTTALAGLTKTTSSYIYLDVGDGGVNTSSITSATEGQTIHFNLNIEDADRDDYQIELAVDFNDGAGFVTLPTAPVIANPIVRSDTDIVDIQDISYTIPENFMNDSFKDVTFKITVTDIPYSATALADVKTITNFRINSYNPFPVSTGPGSNESPLMSSVNNVVTGFPFTIDPDPDNTKITDASLDTPENSIIYQWRIDLDCDGTFYAIPNATEKILVWTPPPQLTTGTKLCFELCLGDEGYGNPADCTINPTSKSGPWVGAANNFVTAIDNSNTISSSSANVIESATYFDTASTTLYTIYTSNENKINLVKSVYNNGALDSTTRSDCNGSSEAVEPHDISITSDGTYLFIAYLIDDVSATDNTTTILRINMSDLSIGHKFTINSPNAADIGRIVTNGTKWYLPMLNLNNASNVTVISAANAVDATDANTNLANSFSYTEIVNTVDSANTGMLILATKDSSNKWYLQNYTLNTLQPVANSYVANIFNNALLTDVNIALGNTSNSNLFIYGENSANSQIALAKFPHAPLSIAYASATNNFNDGIDSDGNFLTNLKSFNLIPTLTSNEILVSYIDSTNILKTAKISTAGDISSLAAVAAASVSTRVNPTGVSIGDYHIATSVIDDFIAGDIGAEATDNTRDALFLLYQKSTFELQSTLINIEASGVQSTSESTSYGYFPGYYK